MEQSAHNSTAARHQYEAVGIPQLITLPEVVGITGISKSEIHRRMKAGRFPKPVKLGSGRCTRWSIGEISAWVNDRLAERDVISQKSA